MTTRYDMLMSNGEPHPLAGVPQEVLDVARAVLRPIFEDENLVELLEPVADAVVLELREAGYLSV